MMSIKALCGPLINVEARYLLHVGGLSGDRLQAARSGVQPNEGEGVKAESARVRAVNLLTINTHWRWVPSSSKRIVHVMGDRMMA